MKKLYYLITFLIAFNSILLSQIETQVEWLKNFSQEQSALTKTQRAEAESIATIQKIPVRYEFPDGSVIELQRFEYGLPVYHATDNLNAAKTVSTDQVWNTGFGGFNLSGAGQILGLWEAGGHPLNTHQELSGRMVQMDGATTITQHATHVAGTLIASGVNATAIGMSNGGIIHYYNSTNDLSEVSSAAANNLKVSNHSYGSIRGWRPNYFNDNKWAWFGQPEISETEDWQFGFYTATSASWDNMLYNAPYILVVGSSGNDRGEGPNPGTEHWANIGGTWQLSNATRDRDGGINGFDCIGDPRKIAKNSLAVGAINDIPNGYKQPSDVVMSSFSSWGPMDDGRIKPDVVANGVGLFSSSNGSVTEYATLSGTSMSSPNVAGSIGLILENQQNLNGNTPLRSATVKALIIHTADEAGSAPGPDYIFGWGLVNTLNAVKVMRLDHEAGNDVLIKEEILNNSSQFSYQVQSNGIVPLMATIVWTDPFGTPATPSLNPPDIMLVNDLDLKIIGPGGTYMPWVLDKNNPSNPATKGDNIVDNVEQVVIENPIAGTYTVQVTHKGTLINSLQAFSMIVTGTALAVPDQVSLTFPSNNSTQVINKPIFEWNHSLRSFNYQIQVAQDAQFNLIVLDSIVSGPKYQSPDLLGLATYYWRVRGINSGGEGVWSEEWSFTTELIAPQSPELFYPVDLAENLPTDIEFVWGSSSQTDNYRLQVASNVTFNTMIFNDSTLTDTSFVVSGLGDGRRYFWRVNAKNTAGNGLFSTPRRFITILYSPSDLFASADSSGIVMLNWVDNSLNESKFFITRKIGNGPFEVIDSLGANSTSYTDTDVQVGNEYTYKVYCSNNLAISDFSNEATVTVVSVENEMLNIPLQYELYSNYPNPFNPGTSIRFALPFESNVRLKIYNALGEVIIELVNGSLAAGFHEIYFNSQHLASGVYFYAIESKSITNNEFFNSVKKMLLLK